MLQFVLIFVFVASGSSASKCLEDISTKRVFYNHYFDTYIDGQYQTVNWKDFPENNTITCSDIYSLGQISYNYKNQDYDQFLIIKNSNISSINSLELFKFKRIKKLYLNYSYIEEIFPGAFTGLTYLTELYLSDNKLKEISNGVYNTLHTLKILNLTNNQIDKIDSVSLVGLSNLTHLYLGKNNLKRFSGNYLETMSRLEYLDLSGNPLEEFAFDKILNMSVKYLFLSGSNLKKLSCDLSNLTFGVFDLSDSKISEINFKYLPKSNKTDLSKNNISVFENCDLITTEVFNLEENNISGINCSFSNISEIYLGHNKLRVLETSRFLYPEFVLVLDLSYNLFTDLSKSFFCNFTRLEILKLGNNKFSAFSPDFFFSLSQLKFLDLSGNRLSKIQFGVFDNLNQLKILNISANKLRDLHQLTFTFLDNLEELYFDSNQISSVDVVDLGQHFPNLEIISLNYNPWNCENLIQSYKYLKLKNVRILGGNSYDVENFHGIACQNSQKLNVLKNTEGLSYQEIADKMQEAINEGVENSKLDVVFNENFQRSKFVQFFDKDYQQSNLFKYINNLKFMVTHEDHSNGTKSDRFTALETLPQESSNRVLVFVSVLLVIIAFMLLANLYFNFKLFQTLTPKRRPESSSEIELC